MNFEDGLKQVTERFKADMEASGGSICACCLAPVSKSRIHTIGVFLRDAPAVTGKKRLVAYCVCKKCWRTFPDQRMEKIEDNLTRTGVYLDPDSEGKQDLS